MIILRKVAVAAAVLSLVGVGIYFYIKNNLTNSLSDNPMVNLEDLSDKNIGPVVIAQGLEIPWDLAFLPNGRMLVTERKGRLFLIEANGERKEIKISDVSVSARGEGGLLGIALHPDFTENSWIYLYKTTTRNNQIINQVSRYWFDGNQLTTPSVIVDNIPGSTNHDGGRIDFGPDGYLYITTGDASDPAKAQDLASLAGKILRVNPDGSVPAENSGTAVYSFGHRNPQGLAWDNNGRLWSTEHGRSGLRSGLDEINLIEIGGNYGWPESEGDTVLDGTIGPVSHSGTNDTWAPASLAFVVNSGIGAAGSLFFGGLRGSALYESLISDESIIGFRDHFKNEYGRIRTVRLGPDGYLYFTTSNRDGRGSPRSGDDKIIRVHPDFLKN